MPGVHSDPVEIRRFVAALKQFNNDLNNSSARTNAQVKNLGEYWRDQEYEKFAREMEQVIQGFRRYLESSEGFIRHLESKASALEAFLKHR